MPWPEETQDTCKWIRALLIDHDKSRAGLIARMLRLSSVAVDHEEDLPSALARVREREPEDRYQVILVDLGHLSRTWESLLQAISEADPAAVLVGLSDVSGVVNMLGATSGERYGVIVLPSCPEEGAAETWGRVVGAMLVGEVSRTASPARRLEALQRQTLALVRALDPVLRDALAASRTPAPVPLPASGIGRLLARLAEAEPKVLAGAAGIFGGALTGALTALTAWLQSGGIHG
ncbi:MAG: hypothetical protein D6722_25075 [Bacteroidetes bacterium]|nr:MAG: hypothetical protein D6722_25075 [Bacteroidota bacterium]